MAFNKTKDMAYNANTGIIYIDTNASPNVGVSIYDLQRALGRSENDLGLLCSDKKWSGSSLVAAGKINPMAKYKAVRHSALKILSISERASVRYGFGGGLPPTLDLTQNNIPQNNWVYLPPRGMGGGSGGANEWYRIRDFEGYATGACAPLCVVAGQLVYDEGIESQILLFGNGMSNSVRQDGGTWEADESLSLTELLHSAEDVYGYYISFLLVDETDYAKNLLVTRKTMGDFVDSDYAMFVFPVYAQGQEVSGITYPAVPILSASRAGHTFSIVACLLPGNNPQSGYGYNVFTSETTPRVSTLIPYSLGFSTGCDRAQAELAFGEFKMDGTQVTAINVIVTDMAMEETLSGQVFRAYSLEIRATVSTVGAAAYTGEKAISGSLSFATSGMFGPTAASGTSLSPQGAAMSGLVSRTSGQSRMIWSSGGVNYMWLPKVNGSVVRTSLALSLEFDYPFSSGAHATGSTTVYVPN